MRFEVHGVDLDELDRRARAVLERFGGRDWTYDITAEAQIAGSDGDVVMWRGDVEATA